MTYDNGEGLIFEFDPHWSPPEPDVGWVGGWEICVTEIRRLNDDGEIIEFITTSVEIKKSTSDSDYRNMELIAEKDNK